MALPSPVGGSLIGLCSSSSCSSPRRFHCAAVPFHQSRGLCLRVVQAGRLARLRLRGSIRLDRVLTHDEADDIGDGFFQAVEELERMVREPSDVLGDMVERLSARELQLVLVYFAQEGRDAYCALEVFDWLRRENRVDGETMELMVSIACGWIERLIGEDRAVEDVVGLLNEIDCVGLEPSFSMVEKVISLYWDSGKEEEAVEFVKDVLRRGGIGNPVTGKDGRGGLVGYLAWKMMADGKYMDAVKLVIDFRESGLKPEVYSYILALTALVKEQKEFSKTLRILRGSMKTGLVEQLDSEDLGLVEQYQSDLLANAIRLSEWAIHEGRTSTIPGVVHERLLALYTCAGCGLKAEKQLWEVKLSGKQPDRELYDIILAICASQNEEGAVGRLLAGMDATGGGAGPRKKTLLWLLRGYLKGGHYVRAAETLAQMLDVGFYPAYLDRAAVLQGLRKKTLQEPGGVDAYLSLCRRLSDADLIGPCLVYVHIKKYDLWVMRLL